MDHALRDITFHGLLHFQPEQRRAANLGGRDDPLARDVRRLWPVYVANHATLHHVGDEIVVTAALAAVPADDRTIADAGCTGGIVRWWSARTLSAQPALADVLGRSLFHPPADKAFLAAQASQPFDSGVFLDRYRHHVRRKLLVRRAVAPLRRMLRRGDGHVMPRLA